MKRHHSLQQASRGSLVLLVIIGLLLGTVFIFVMQHQHAPVTPEAAHSVAAVYASHRVSYASERDRPIISNINRITLTFADGSTRAIDGSCASAELLADLSALEAGTPLTLLVHPNSRGILSIVTPEGTLLSFEETAAALSGEKWGFTALGLFMYFCAGLGIHLLRKRKYA